MKKSKTVLIFLVAVLILATAALAFCACNDKGSDKDGNGSVVTPPDGGGDNEEDPKPPVTNLFYSQEEVIGWSKSVSAFNAYPDFKASAQPAFVVPGLKKGQNFVLQGVEYCAELNWTFLCGYIKPDTSKKNSVIFVLDMNRTVTNGIGKSYSGALIKEIFLQKEDGSAYTGHAGGIAVTGKNVWVANVGRIYRLPLSDIVAASPSSEMKFAGSVKVPVLASYCSFASGMLWVGEFEYAKDGYVTDAAHHNADNASLKGWTVGYAIDESGAQGFDSATGIKAEALQDIAVPDCVLWHREKVQGMAEAGNRIVLSTSYGRKNDSVLYIYDNPVRGGFAKGADTHVSIGGQSVPCYLLSSPLKRITAPPMSEDLSVVSEDGKIKVFIATESASFYYHGSNLFSKSKNPTDFIWKVTVEQQ